jgi:hypothetical protein
MRTPGCRARSRVTLRRSAALCSHDSVLRSLTHPLRAPYSPARRLRKVDRYSGKQPVGSTPGTTRSAAPSAISFSTPSAMESTTWGTKARASDRGRNANSGAA